MKEDRNIRLWRNRMRFWLIKLICSGRQIIWSTRSHISLIHYSILVLTVTQKKTNKLSNRSRYNCWSSDLLWLFILYVVNGTIIVWQIVFIISVKQKTAFSNRSEIIRSQLLMDITDNKILAISTLTSRLYSIFICP